ncbi:hypothetical protein A9K55_000435 [Cordyceps militaris]|uniref:PD-(D/E)XK nuclease-like domain-containing protein n=1 Tax=Cordyceps militaris TaxID=73501 RepID=A0A2H4SVN3_CORMI|nr:hypothetical protein A9K55_000435 [Cordyceps militaris]
MSGSSAIHLWLSGLPDAKRSLKRPREPNMVTPPRSCLQTERSQSPSKKRKTDKDADEDNGGSSISRSDIALSPQPFLPSLVMRPGSIYPASIGHSSAASFVSDRQSSRRSASPVKTITGLQRLDKPVLYRPIDDDNPDFEELPKDVRQLHNNILAVTIDRIDIYPAEIRTQIESLLTLRPPPDCAYRQLEKETDDNRGRLAQGTGKPDAPFFDFLPLSSLFAELETTSLQTRFALAELYQLRTIESLAKECLALRRSEAAWNALVHGPLLKLALSRQHGSVFYEYATSARILSSFRPSLITGEVSEGKMVDFVLAPRLSADLDSAIQNRLIELSRQSKSSALASSQLFVNQTDYTPLMRSPLAISIETKVAGARLEEGRLQLGIWTASWYKRMEMLGIGCGMPDYRLPTLPLILVCDHQWSLYFAIDRLDRIEIRGPLQIGMTDHLTRIYPLLTVLGLLSTWIDTTFRSWVTNTFMPRS